MIDYKKISRDIVLLMLGVLFAAPALQGQTVPLGDHKCSSTTDDRKDWSMVRSYDFQGNVIGASIEYKDFRGRVAQTQSWSAAHDEVIAMQPLYDKFGRPVLQTLSAPINTDKFCYKSDFITGPSGTAYSSSNFEGLKLNNPDAVNNTTQDGLGWWYSNNNTDEPYQATTSFPFTQTEYSTRTNRARRVSRPGDELRMGRGREAENYTMQAAGELYYVYGYSNGWTMSTATHSITTPNYQAYKTIGVDAEGQEQVTFRDRDGKLIATALSGSVNGVNQQVQHVTSVIGEKGYVDIHLPEGCQSSLTLYNPHNNIHYEIIDLKTDEVLQFGENYYFSGTRPDLSSGFYRIRDLKFTVTAVAGGNLLPYFPSVLQNYTMQIDLPVNYDLNYYEFALNYYDQGGRLVKTIPPLGIATSYSPNPVTLTGNTFNFPLYFSNGDLSFSSSASVPNARLNLSSQVSQDEYKEIRVEFRHKTVSDQTIVRQASLLSAILSDEPGEIGPASDELYYSHAMRDQIEISSTNTHLKAELGGDFNFSTPSFKQYPTRLPDPLNHLACLQLAEVYEIYYDVFSSAQYSNDPNNPDIASNRRLWIIKKYDEDCQVEAIELNGDKFIVNNTLINARIGELEFVIRDLKKITVNTAGGESPTSMTAADYAFVDDYKLFFGEKTFVSGQPSHNMATTYSYNSLGWLISLESPDEGKTEYTYRKDGQLRFSQNAQQKLDGQFSYVHYDAFGRAVERGVYTTPESGGYTFQKYAAPPIAGGTNYILENVHSYSNTLTDGLDDQHCSEQVFSLYDVKDAAMASTIGGLSSYYKQHFLRGRLSKVWDASSTTWYSYDELGRRKWILQELNGLGDVKTLDYNYNGRGKVSTISYQQYDAAERLDHHFSYDGNGRLSKVHSSLEGAYKVEQAAYEYYKDGPPKRAEVGARLQGMDYVYTVNGMLKNVNSPTMLNQQDPGRDGFSEGSHPLFQPDLIGMSLDYYQNDYKREGTYINAEAGAYSSYVGNISAMRWNKRRDVVESFEDQEMYRYQYDHQNRLTRADYGLYVAGNCINMAAAEVCSNPVNAAFTADALNNYRVWGLTYDANSNLLTLNRNGYGNTAQLLMDQFSYNYATTASKRTDNKLTHISDAGDNIDVNRYKDIKNQGSNNYTYNAIGQMVDNHQEDSYILYNDRGLVSVVYGQYGTSNQYKKVEYIYNALGYRSQKIDYADVSGSGNIAQLKTWYVRDGSGRILATYEQDMTHPETPLVLSEQPIYGLGRLGVHRPHTTPHGRRGYTYEIKDHQGNVRSTYANEPGTDHYTDFTKGTLDGWILRPNTNISYPTGLQIHTLATGGVRKVFSIPAGGVYTVSVNLDIVNALGVKMTVIDLSSSPTVNLGTKMLESGYNEFSFANTSTTSLVVHIFIPNSHKITTSPGSTFVIKDVNVIKNELVVHTQRDYYPFGMEMPGKSYTSADGGYRYAYQGQERDGEPGASHEFFELRTWDGRMGRWTAPDPYGQFFSPYNGMGNNPVSGTDPDGGFFKQLGNFIMGFGWHPHDFAGTFGPYDYFGDINISSLSKNVVDFGRTMGDALQQAISPAPDLEKYARNNFTDTYNYVEGQGFKMEWYWDNDDRFTNDVVKGHTRFKGYQAKFSDSKVLINYRLRYHKGEEFRLVVGHELEHMRHLASGEFDQWVKDYNEDTAAEISEFEAWTWTLNNAFDQTLRDKARQKVQEHRQKIKKLTDGKYFE